MIVALVGRILARLLEVVTKPPAMLGLGIHLRRALVMLGVLAALMLVPIRLTPHSAKVAGLIALAALLLALVSAAAGLERFLAAVSRGGRIVLFGGKVDLAIPLVGREVRELQALLILVRRAGIALPAVVFFCLWALAYAVIWAYSPGSCPADPAVGCGGAFLGAGTSPTFGDFLYFATNMAFANPVPDLIARSSLAHAAATLEVLTGIVLVTFFARSFFGIGGEPAIAKPSPD